MGFEPKDEKTLPYQLQFRRFGGQKKMQKKCVRADDEMVSN
jgi:hypothetical protein